MMPEAPTINGEPNPRQWTAAAILPPVHRADGVTDDFNTHIYLGWRETSLFIRIEHHFSIATADTLVSQAPAADATMPNPARLCAGDHLELTFKTANGGAGVLVGPTGVLPVSGKEPSSGWATAVTRSDHGWEARIQMPLSMIGATSSSAPIQLEVSREELSVGALGYRLSTELSLMKQLLAVRVIEAGAFSHGHQQGMLLEIVNAGAEEIACTANISLDGQQGPVQPMQRQTLTMPADSCQRLCVTADPIAVGRLTAHYQIETASTTLASDDVAFDSGGLLQTRVKLFFLWRGGVYVTADCPPTAGAAAATNTPVDLSFRLTDAAGSRVLQQARAQSARPGSATVLLNTRGAKPGAYRIVIECIEHGKVTGRRTERIVVPPTPAWWPATDGPKPDTPHGNGSL
jgi:hypothetical protein